MTDPDPYETIGVDKDASHDHIKKVYRKKVRKTHPDRNPDNLEAEEEFKRLATAYMVLGDPEKRQHFDDTGERKKETNDQANAVKLLVDLFQKMCSHACRLGHPEFNIIDEMKSKLEHTIQQCGNVDIEKADHQLEILEVIRKKLITKNKDPDEPGIFEVTLENLIRSEKRNKEISQEAIRIGTIALERLDGYEYDFQEKKQWK